jgi:hypothetical protein
MASEQSPGFINEFDCIMVGIIAFAERRGPQDIEAETGFPDPVGIQEIQHCADRLGGFPGHVVKQGDPPRSNNCPYLFLC